MAAAGAKYQIVAEQTGTWKREQGLTVTQNVLTSLGAQSLQAVVAESDEMALGALEALRSSGVSGVKVIGFDATPEALKLVRSGEMAATVEQSPMNQARTALRQLVAQIRQHTPMRGREHRACSCSIRNPTSIKPSALAKFGSGAMLPNLLNVRDVCKQFPGVKALDGVELQVRAGEVHALLGENGAGKSTLLKILSGALRADRGEATLDGVRLEPSDTPRQRQRAGLVTIYQEFNLLPYMSIAENLYLGREPQRRGLYRLGRDARQVAHLAGEPGAER